MKMWLTFYDYCHPILTAVRWSKGCEPHLWQIGITLIVACYHPEWFEWILMQIVSLNNVLILLRWCDWPEVVNVKCDLQPDRALCSVSKVRCSVVLWCLQAVSFHLKNNISHCVLLSRDKNRLVLHDKWVQPTICITSPYSAKI